MILIKVEAFFELFLGCESVGFILVLPVEHPSEVEFRHRVLDVRFGSRVLTRQKLESFGHQVDVIEVQLVYDGYLTFSHPSVLTLQLDQFDFLSFYLVFQLFTA